MIGEYYHKFLASALAIVLFSCTPARAAEAPCPKLDRLPLVALLLPPPCDTCAETTAELAELLKLETSRTPDQAKHAGDDHKRSIGRFLGEIGIKIGDRLPVSGPFFDCLAETVEDETRDAKAIFHRTRPYKLPDNQLHILKELKADDSFSYPSGHATYGTVVGLVLAEMIPEKREEIIRRIEDYGYSRMVAGVHFRSDVYAGQVSGAAITASLFTNEEFRMAFEQAKAEIRRVLGY